MWCNNLYLTLSSWSISSRPHTIDIKHTRFTYSGQLLISIIRLNTKASSHFVSYREDTHIGISSISFYETFIETAYAYIYLFSKTGWSQVISWYMAMSWPNLACVKQPFPVRTLIKMNGSWSLLFIWICQVFLKEGPIGKPLLCKIDATKPLIHSYL